METNAPATVPLNPKPLSIPMEKINEIERAYGKFVPPKQIEDAGQRALVSSELVAIATQKKWLTNALSDLTTPIRALEKQVRDYFRFAGESLESADKVLRNLVKQYDNQIAAKLEAQRRQQQAEANRIAEEKRRQLAQAAAEAELEGHSAVAVAIKEQVQEVVAPVVGVPEIKYNDGTSTRKVRKWRVKDEAKIPDYLWILDEKTVGKLCRTGVPAPEGLEFYEELETTVRPGSL